MGLASTCLLCMLAWLIWSVDMAIFAILHFRYLTDPHAYALVVRFNFPCFQVVHVLGIPLVMPEVFSSQQRMSYFLGSPHLTDRANLGHLEFLIFQSDYLGRLVM